MDIASEILKTYQSLSSSLVGQDLTDLRFIFSGLLGNAFIIPAGMELSDTADVKQNLLKYLNEMDENHLHRIYNNLQEAKSRFLSKQGIPKNNTSINDYEKEFPKFFNVFYRFFDPYETYYFNKFTHTDLRPVLFVAEEMPEYFQRVIADRIYHNISKAFVLTSLALEFPILKNPICDNLVNFEGTTAEIKKRIHLAELIIKDFGSRLDDRVNAAWTILSKDRITEKNYKQFFNQLLNPSYSGISVIDAYNPSYYKYNRYLKPELLSFHNAKKFCQLFNDNFKGVFNINNTFFHKFIDFLVASWGKDLNFAGKLAEFFSFNKYFYYINIEGFIFLSKLIISGDIPCSNLEQLSSLFRGFNLIERKIHNLYGDLATAEIALDSEVVKHIIITFLNNKYDVSNDLLSKAIDLVLNESLAKEQNITTKCLELGINPTDLRHQLNDLKQQFFFHRLRLDKSQIYDLDNKINLIESYSGILQYKQYKKDKVPELYNLNYIISDHLKFEVLSNNSFEYFTVGVATGCCQRLKREGVAACVDSYINPMAGVLVLKLRTDKKWIVIAQSYFHYVPEDNGYILDNVETNDWAVKHFKINLESLYASLGAKLKESGVSYFRCGLRYNKLNNSAFTNEQDSDDKRYFEVEELDLELDNGYEKTSGRYADYDHSEFLNLYLPDKNIPLVELYPIEKTSALSLQFYSMLLKIANKLTFIHDR